MLHGSRVSLKILSLKLAAYYFLQTFLQTRVRKSILDTVTYILDSYNTFGLSKNVIGKIYFRQ